MSRVLVKILLAPIILPMIIVMSLLSLISMKVLFFLQDGLLHRNLKMTLPINTIGHIEQQMLC